LYYGVFDEAEEPEAFKRLLSLIRAKNNTFDCGFIGMHTIFHVLSRFGRADLAYEMIMRRDFPGYGHLIEVGETALPEKLMADPLAAESHNHHFLGDYMRWFVINIAGLEVKDSHTVRIAPQDIEGIDFAEAWYELPAGRVAVRWAKNEAGERVIRVTAPDGVEIIR
jgi:alpha-L-rhamnosidase